MLREQSRKDKCFDVLSWRIWYLYFLYSLWSTLGCSV